MKIYLAARYSRREELCAYAEQLRAVGHKVTSRWLEGSHQISDDGLSEEGSEAERVRFAIEDLIDLIAAHCVVCFTEPPRTSNSRGGRHVEMGIGIGVHKCVHVVGYRENVFCCLPKVRFHATWEEALAYFTPSRP